MTFLKNLLLGHKCVACGARGHVKNLSIILTSVFATGALAGKTNEGV